MPSKKQTAEEILQLLLKRADQEFECPECGSTCWGTGDMTRPFEEWYGYCHGENGCRFRWKRKDDAEVMHYKITLSFDEYREFGGERQERGFGEARS